MPSRLGYANVPIFYSFGACFIRQAIKKVGLDTLGVPIMKLINISDSILK